MKITPCPRPEHSAPAFATVQALVSSMILGILMVSLYAGISFGFTTIRVARENLRATQILLEKTEIVRLCTWDQLNTNNFLPKNFTAPYYIDGSTNFSGLVYTGTLDIRQPPSGQLGGSGAGAYHQDMRVVTINLSWTSMGKTRTREASTYVSRYGTQNYIFN